MLHQRICSGQHETAARFPRDGSINTHDESNSHGSDRGDVLEVGQHFIARQSLDLVHFGLHVFHLRSCNETSFAAQDAYTIVVFNINLHGVSFRSHTNSLTRDSETRRKSPPWYPNCLARPSRCYAPYSAGIV